MKTFIAGLMLAWVAVGQEARLSDAEKASGFVLLFDGRTTEGWREITGEAFPKSWTVEGGCLKAIAGLPGFQDIRTVGEWKNFEFRFSWRVAKAGNSGVKYRLDKVDRWASKDGKGYHARARGREYQIVDDALNADARLDPKNTAGALYGKVAPAKAAARPAGDWNEGRIVVRGEHLEHWLNGVKVVDAELAGAEKAGPVSLQNHDSEVWFRDLRIREIP